MRDVLDLFGELPDYPGKRKPKNREEKQVAGRESIPVDPFFNVPKKTVVIKNQETDLYTVGAVAQIIGRKQQTLRKWEEKGWIPAPTYRSVKSSGSPSVNGSGKGYRLYTRAQVEVLLTALEENGLLGDRNPSWQEPARWLSFIEHVKANWPK